MRTNIFGFLFLISILSSSSSSSSSPSSAAYHWPLGAPPALTSTFGEHRFGHLHAGVDVKTWGRQGYEVYAVADGYVWRVRTSPWGYGKALYLRLVDGRTAVYGHLSAFADEIQTVVQAEQERRGRYRIDLYPEAGRIPVIAGQVVAFSGRSGCAHPHLHFELRDEHNRPINPLCHGFTVADGRAPRMVSVGIRPVGLASSVDGVHQAALIPLSWDAAQQCYTISSIPHVEGRAGLSLATYDLADGAQNRLHVYALKVMVDGRPIFASEYEQFTFETSDQVDLDTDFDLYRNGRGVYRNLYLAPGNRLPFYRPDQPGSGLLSASILGAGLHQVTLWAEDQAGNRSHARFQVLLDERPDVEDLGLFEDSLGVQVRLKVVDPDGDAVKAWIEVSRDLGRHWNTQPLRQTTESEVLFQTHFNGGTTDPILVRAWAEDEFGIRSRPQMEALGTVPDLSGEPRFNWDLIYHGDFVELSIEADRLLRRPPKVIFNRPGEDPRRVQVFSQGLHRYRGRCSLMGGPDGQAVFTVAGRDLSGNLGVEALTLTIQTITPGEGGRVEGGDHGIRAVFPPGAVYQAFVARIEPTRADVPAGLVLIGRPYTLFPQDRVFDEPATVWLSISPDQESNRRIAVYRLRGQDRWTYLGRLVREEGGALGARLKSFSTVALLEDRIDPLIWRVKPANGSRLSDRLPTLSAGIRDRGSGIGDEEQIVLKLDGRRVIGEYDPPIETVFHRPRYPMSPGEHLFEIEITDRAGNRTVAKSRFTILP
jgi:hypothetical protein